MLTKVFAGCGGAIALVATAAAYTQPGALALRQESQDNYWPRDNTTVSGSYRSGVWSPAPGRASYGGFQGGGPGSGK
jgi:hypothetical protein